MSQVRERTKALERRPAMRRLLTGVEQYLTGASDISAWRALLSVLGVFAAFLLLSLSQTFLKTLPPSVFIQAAHWSVQALLVILALLIFGFLAVIVLRSVLTFYSSFSRGSLWEEEKLIRKKHAAEQKLEKQQLLLKQVLEEHRRLKMELNHITWEAAASQNADAGKDRK